MFKPPGPNKVLAVVAVEGPKGALIFGNLSLHYVTPQVSNELLYSELQHDYSRVGSTLKPNPRALRQ
jgi:hypothetical protein